MLFPIPKRIGDHQVVRRLSTEGAAEIFLAREEGPMGFSRDVVIKLVRADSEGDPLHAAELGREARICARLNHPGIVRMFDFFEERDRMALVLEYVDGPALDELLAYLAEKDEKLSDDEACVVASSVTAALAHAHALTDENGAPVPVLHRALSPKKVLVARDGTVKLGGFGFGKILDRTPDSAIGLVRGTPGYMAPEQARGEHLDARADVYAAGMLCWQLLTMGRAALPTGKVPSLATVRDDLPRELVAAVDAALEEDRDQRKITCAELSRWIAMVARLDEGKRALRAHVEAFAAAEEYEEVAPESIVPARPSRRRARALRRGSALGARVLAREASEGRLPAAPENAAPNEPVNEAANEAVKIEEPSAPMEMPAARAMTMMGIGPDRNEPLRPRREAPDAPSAPGAGAPPSPFAPIVMGPAQISVPSSPIATDTELEEVRPARGRSRLALVAVLFALVVGATLVVFVVGRSSKPTVVTPATPSSTAATSASLVEAPTASIAETAETTAPSTPPSPSVTASSSPPPLPSTTASASIAVPTTPLPKGWGWVVVHSTSGQKVLINGKRAGDVGTPIAFGCGPRSIAVAKYDKNGNLIWMTKAQWFNVKCGSVISELTIK